MPSFGRWIALLATAVMVASIQTTNVIASGGLERYSYDRPWTIFKRQDGSCLAFSQALQGDVFIINIFSNTLVLSLGNPRFNIPPGTYPAELDLNGSMIMPSDQSASNGVVQKSNPHFISFRFVEHQMQNFPKASLLTVHLAGKIHMLFLDDTAGMMRDLSVCSKYQSDPLKSAR